MGILMLLYSNGSSGILSNVQKVAGSLLSGFCKTQWHFQQGDQYDEHAVGIYARSGLYKFQKKKMWRLKGIERHCSCPSRWVQLGKVACLVIPRLHKSNDQFNTHCPDISSGSLFGKYKMNQTSLSNFQVSSESTPVVSIDSSHVAGRVTANTPPALSITTHQAWIIFEQVIINGACFLILFVAICLSFPLKKCISDH